MAFDRTHSSSACRALLLVLALLFDAPAAAQDGGLTFDGLIKAGVEADTNPARLTGEGSEVDAVERLFIELNLSSRAARQAVLGQIRVGAKRFHTTGDEDAVVFDADGSFRRLLLDDFGVFVRLQARNRTERGHLRDYVRVATQGGLFVTPSTLTLSAGPSFAYFLYRPDSELSHVGLGGTGQVSWSPSDVVTVSGTYGYERREYAQEQVISDELVGLTLAQGESRIDRTHLTGLALSLQFDFLTKVDLLWQRNLSNSFGKAFSRLTARASVTAALPLSLWVTGQLSVQRTLFDDDVLVDPTFAIDEENRNAFILSLSGDITRWLRWEARYNLYTQEFGGDDSSYVRHLVYGGLVAVIGE